MNWGFCAYYNIKVTFTLLKTAKFKVPNIKSTHFTEVPLTEYTQYSNWIIIIIDALMCKRHFNGEAGRLQVALLSTISYSLNLIIYNRICLLWYVSIMLTCKVVNNKYSIFPSEMSWSINEQKTESARTSNVYSTWIHLLSYIPPRVQSQQQRTNIFHC